MIGYPSMQEAITIRDSQTGRVYSCFVGTPVHVGREDEGTSPDVSCDDKHVSRQHCQLHAESDGRLRIVDQSSYGTFINGERISGPRALRPGDIIRLGTQVELGFQIGAPASL